MKGYGTTAQLGTRLFRNSAATSAFGRPTSFGLGKTQAIPNALFEQIVCPFNLYTLQYYRIKGLIVTLGSFI